MPVAEVTELLLTYSAIGRRSTQLSCSLLMYDRRYASITWLILSVCPSVCGWNAVDIRGRIPVTDQKSFHVCDVNLESRLDMMSRSRPCRRHISQANIRARSSAFFLFCSRGMKWENFKNRSITTHNSVQLFDHGRSMIKSMAIDCHGAYGSSRGERSPYFPRHRNLSIWLSGHAWMYFSISESILGHQKFRHTSPMVFSCPLYPATYLSYSDSRIVAIIGLLCTNGLGSGECCHSPWSSV